jgi:AraC-like DNA-binding protein
MTKIDVKENYLDFYTTNGDWKGSRTLENDFEIIEYQNNSTIRIWCNDQIFGYEPHWHTALEIIMPVENYYEVIITRTTYRVLPGQVLVIPPGEMHQLIAPDNGKRFIFQFNILNITKLKGFTGIQALLTQPLYITPNTYPEIYDEIYQLLMQMRNEYFSTNDYRELAIYSLLINFFVAFGRNHLNTIGIFPNVHIYKQKEYVQKFNTVLDHIDAHYMENLSLDDIASFIGFSKYHFTRLFKQYTNSTFYDYLIYTRIKVAEGLLTAPDLSITEIALQSGFSSISTFNRTFKQQKNCTPSEYRALYT